MGDVPVATLLLRNGASPRRTNADGKLQVGPSLFRIDVCYALKQAPMQLDVFRAFSTCSRMRPFNSTTELGVALSFMYDELSRSVGQRASLPNRPKWPANLLDKGCLRSTYTAVPTQGLPLSGKHCGSLRCSWICLHHLIKGIPSRPPHTRRCMRLLLKSQAMAFTEALTRVHLVAGDTAKCNTLSESPLELAAKFGANELVMTLLMG